MTFADALATFVSYYTMHRHAAGKTITFEELVGGLIGCLACAIEQCDEEDQATMTKAIHRALDNRLLDSANDRELPN